MNVAGFIARDGPSTLSPLGAVAPTRIVSLPWPVAPRAPYIASASLRYSRGEFGIQRPWPLILRTVHCGASHAPWLGSFQISHQSMRGSGGPGAVVVS